MSSTTPRATVADLHRTEGRAELVGGRIVRLPYFGCKPGDIVGNVAFNLNEYERRTGRGEVGTATLAYVVPPLPSGRESFSPAVSYYVETAYRGDPHTPVAIFRRGDVADAEPAVPGWRMPVDEIFAEGVVH